MKTIILVIGLLGFAFNSSGQSISVDTTKIFESKDNDEGTYPVGYKSMIKFLMENLSYPDSSKKGRIEGTVKVSFCIDTTGKVTDIKILQGINNEIDNEVIRVFKLLPDWEPIIIAGRKEKINLKLPIRFNSTKSEKH